MKSLAIFSTILTLTAARSCIVKAPANEQSDAEEIILNPDVVEGSDDEIPTLDGAEEDSNDEQSKKLPADFKWGAATSAYQIEGAWNADESGESIWDHFSHLYPSNIITSDPSNPNTTNGDVAVNSYYQYRDDIEMLKIMNAKYYRFSFSWPRIFPDGVAKDEQGNWRDNEKGAQHYDDVINALLENGIAPFVTLYHWDLPYALHEKYGGWLDYHVQYDFADYAEYCFQRYGDRVKNWITINEPWISCVYGYNTTPGKAPFRCINEPPRGLQANKTGLDLKGGCSYEIGPSQYCPDCEVLEANRPPKRLEDVWCTHNVLLAHGQAAKIYHEKYQAKQKGLIGITVDGESQIPWYEPGMSDEELANNEKYAELLFQLRIAWYADPTIFGDYPDVVKERMGKELPVFTEEEKEMMKNSSVDFIGWNAYTTHWVSQRKNEDGTYVQPPTAEEAGYDTFKKDIWDDNCRTRGPYYNCLPPSLGSLSGSIWNTKYAPGVRVGLNWFQKRYGSILKNGILITENGCAQPNVKNSLANDQITLEYFKSIGQEDIADTYSADIIEDESNPDGTIIHDNYRVDWYKQYLENIRLAYVEDGVDIRGYMGWSVVDNFEWGDGYESRFGMTYINILHDPELKRIPKDSLKFLGQWYLENVEQE